MVFASDRKSSSSSLLTGKPVDGDTLTIDIQMRLIAEMEDAYWQTQFSKETYYAAGRGYDQYRPAYEMGWSAALAYPDAQFGDVAQHLEMQWSSRKSTSLLPWREVQTAVKQAWKHAGQQMHSIQTQLPVQDVDAQLTETLAQLHRACVLLVDDLRRMVRVDMDAFAQQVLGRHMRLLRKIALQLKRLMRNAQKKNHPLAPLQHNLRTQWRRIKSSLGEWEAAQVFEVCELRERSLLAIYHNVLRKPLPTEVQELLQQQKKLLQNNMEKLSWVRQNWVM